MPQRVQGRIFFENSLKRLLQGNIAFQIWTIAKWELLNDNDHPLDLIHKLFFACTGLNALSNHGANAPSPVRILHSPFSYTSNADVKGMVHMVSLCPCWTVYGETISTIAKHSLPHETWSREWDCHLNSTTAKSPPWKTKGWLNIIWKLKWDFTGNLIWRWEDLDYSFRIGCGTVVWLHAPS